MFLSEDENGYNVLPNECSPTNIAYVYAVRQQAELARIGGRIEELYGHPMAIEWALSASRFFIVMEFQNFQLSKHKFFH